MKKAPMGLFLSIMNHYYTDNTNLKSKPTSFCFHYFEHDILFHSDIGVFSKERIDYGSRVLLDAITLSNQKRSLLDVGCGYGTFGICLKKRYPVLEVTMVDVNDRALDLCRQNLVANHIEAKVFQSNGYQNIKESYDVIVTNPPIRAGKKVVFDILDGSIHHLNQEGELWVVVQKKQGAPSIKKRMLEMFGNCRTVKKDKGYYILVSKK